MTKNHEADEVFLTPQQATALPLLASGAKKKDAAATVGVCPQTISMWLREPHFSAALRTQREKLTALASERLRDATEAAVDTVLDLMQSGSEAIKFKAATYILDRVVLLDSNGTLPNPQPSCEDSLGLLAALGVKCS
jgi:hypothetical protein